MYDLNVLFFVKKSKRNKAGEAPIFLRITVNGERSEMSIKRRIKPVTWNSKSQRVTGRSEKVRLINNYIDEIENNVNRLYNIAIQEKKKISAVYLKNLLSGNSPDDKTLIEVFNEYNKLMEFEKGKKYAVKTVARYKHALDHIKDFLKKEYKAGDIELSRLDLKFMRRFDIYLQTENDYHQNTVTKYLKILKTVVLSSISFGYIERNPFHGYTTSYKASNRQYLSREELFNIETKVLAEERLEKVRDVFIFICYTGISYSDLLKLTQDNIQKGIDGKNWLTFERLKTNIRTSIPLLPAAQAVIEKYKEYPECVADNKLVPLISNQKFNQYLKEIATMCKIKKPVTAHIGRHTFATTVTLSNGVPMETVQKMLAHANISTTQIYSKVIDTKISEDMEDLVKKIS